MRSSPRTHFGDLFGRRTTREADRRRGAELLSMEAWSLDSRRFGQGELVWRLGKVEEAVGELLCARDRNKGDRREEIDGRGGGGASYARLYLKEEEKES